MSSLDSLRTHVATLGRVVLGYSGGVDSTLLAVVGRQSLGREHLLAVIGRSASLGEEQAQAALDLANTYDIQVLELATHELEDPHYLSNTTERCYFCKSELWNRLHAVVRQRGFDTLIDGTNADDLREHRPGLRAAAESGVRSPLAELGWTKHAVREAARHLGIASWDAPASPCLSSRVVYGLEITPGRLRQVEQGEAYLRALGISGDLRVRHHGQTARLEVVRDQMELLRSNWTGIRTFFTGLGFEGVEVDPNGYRRGGLLALAQRAPE